MLLVWHVIGNIVTSSLHLSLPLAMIVVRFQHISKSASIFYAMHDRHEKVLAFICMEQLAL